LTDCYALVAELVDAPDALHHLDHLEHTSVDGRPYRMTRPCDLSNCCACCALQNSMIRLTHGYATTAMWQALVNCFGLRNSLKLVKNFLGLKSWEVFKRGVSFG
jgi:hypothetical protein